MAAGSKQGISLLNSLVPLELIREAFGVPSSGLTGAILGVDSNYRKSKTKYDFGRYDVRPRVPFSRPSPVEAEGTLYGVLYCEESVAIWSTSIS